MTVIYGSDVSNGTLSTASTMSSTTGGTEVSQTTTVTGTNVWTEVLSRAATIASVTAIGSPSGKGWVFAPGSGSFATGNWSATVTLSASAPGTTDITIRFYKYSGGTYTSIGTINKTGVTGTKTAYSFTATSMSAVTFGSSDLLYVDLWWHDLSGADDNPVVYESNSSTAGVANDMQVTTSTFTAVTTSSRTIPATAALQSTNSRTIPVTAALQSTNARTVSATAALQSTNSRTIPATAAIANTFSRTIPASVALTNSGTRTIPATAALMGTVSRTIPASVALTVTSSRIIPATASITQPAVFYASNVSSSIGGLTLSDQMSMTNGGTETSFTVTAPSSGTNSYVELLAQGGSSSGTPALPAPTGKGWSIPLQGNTILAGSWSFAFTLAKSGASMTGGALYVRAYRRTMDGTYYYIGSASLSSQTFSTKAVYTTPSVNATLWQFIAGDTLYMDAFVVNTTTAWSSDTFTVYVSNSATQGVYNDAIIIAPQLITTPAELACYIGNTSLQTGTTLPVRDQSFTLADAIDQRSILTLTGEDTAGTLSYQRAMPVYLGDHDQGLLYTGYINSDKVSKPAAGNSNAQLEHMLTFMDPHYLVDKRANLTNYLNWSAGDMICDFISSTLSQEGITGAFAIDSDYSQAAFAQGTLAGTTATTTTTPFVYAPNTATPPITSNTGDLELTRAGTQFTLTEQTSGDFGSGTVTNMTTSGNTLVPTTQSAFEVIAHFPLGYGSNANSTNLLNTGTTPPFFYTWPEDINSATTVKIWSGSQTIASTDTLNYDIWIASTSPEFKAGIDFTCSDGTTFSASAASANCIGGTTGGVVGYYDTNNVSADILTDLSAYAKDAWYSRSIQVAGTMPGNPTSTNSPSLAGKSITGVSVCVWGASTGTYTVYVKNVYLGSASGSPFFSTTATNTNVSPPVVATIGGYVNSGVVTHVVSAYLPQASYRISPSHSISGVGLVQNSNITWTASLPTAGPSNTLPVSALNPTSANTQSTGASPAMVMQISYDNKTWLSCVNNGSLPGLPSGANVSGVSFYLKEYFQSGSDPTAIPALLQVNITINSAAAQTTTDVVANYGNATDWNTGTHVGTQANSGGQLTTGASFTPAWGSGSTAGQTLFMNIAGGTSNSASAGTYTMSGITSNGLWGQSRFDFAGDMTDGIIQADLSFSTVANPLQAGIIYRSTSWLTSGNNQDTNLFAYYVWISGNTGQPFGSHVEWGVGSNSSTTSSYTTLGTYGTSLSANTFYTIKVQFIGNRHIISLNGTEILDQIDNTILTPGGVGLRMINAGGTNGTNIKAKNCTIQSISGTEGVWTSPSTSISALGTCGNSQINWTEENVAGDTQATALVLTSIDGGSTYQQCTNGGAIPGLAVGTNVSGKSVITKMILYGPTYLSTPIIYGLNMRVCGSYGTVSGTRISPALNLSPVGYVGSSNVMWNANIPTSTSLTVATTQDLSTYHTVGSSGAGEALPYWANQPSATQDLFNTNTLANYTNTSKVGGSSTTVTYDTVNSRITLTGGSNALYLNNAITTADIDMLVDMDQSDAGGMVWQELDLNAGDFYELAVYDASSSGGFTNQLRLYKTSSGTRTLLGSASSITFTRGTFHRIRITQSGGLINVYWDGTCVQSYLDPFPLGAGKCGLRNDGGTSRYYQLWVQPLGTNLSGQALWTKVTMTTTDPSMMPQLFTLVACVRGPSIATGATIAQLHPITKPFAAYYSTEIDTAVQASGDFYWYVDKWKQLIFGPRLARPGAFPIQSVADSAGVYSGYLLYQPQVTVLSSADLFRSEMIITNVNGTVTPPAEVKVADGSTTSWTMGYPLYSAPTVLINGQGATVGLQGVDSGHQFYWQPGSASISYDSSLPKLPAGTILSFTYVGSSTVNVVLNNSASQTAQATLEGNSGIVAAIQSALSQNVLGMTTSQATTFGNGLLSRYGNNSAIELVGTTRYGGLVPGTTIPLFLPEMMNTWNAQLPVTRVTTTAYQSTNGLIYLYTVNATNGANLNNWARLWYQG